MSMSKHTVALSAALVGLVLAGCEDDSEATSATATSSSSTSASTGGAGGTGSGGGTGGGSPEAVCDPAAGGFSLDIDNPFLPFAVGNQWVYDGMRGATVIHLEITVLNETEMVAGVETRVVEENEQEDGEIIEISRNFFVQAADGTVCYYGEDVDIYDNGPPPAQPSSHDGAWRAGVDNALPGIMMPANPMVGMQYDQEIAPGIAEDHAEIVAMGASHTVPAGTFADTLETDETTPLEPGAVSHKVYARDVGMLIDAVVQLTSGP